MEGVYTGEKGEVAPELRCCYSGGAKRGWWVSREGRRVVHVLTRGHCVLCARAKPWVRHALGQQLRRGGEEGQDSQHGRAEQTNPAN